MMSNHASMSARRRARQIGGAILVICAATLPAKAQTVDDFLCSTFNYKCHLPPPPPPPDLAPGTPPVAEPVKHAKHHRTHKSARTPAPKTDTAPASPDAK